MGQRYMRLLSEFLAEDRAVDADWRERAHGMEALVAFAAWLDATQHVAEADAYCPVCAVPEGSVHKMSCPRSRNSGAA